MNEGRITIWPQLRNPTGRSQRIAWPKLFEQFSHRVDFEGENHAGWSPAEFDGDRRALDGVRSVHALVLDVDGRWSLPGALEAFGAYYGLIHTSKRHTQEIHRFRVILPLTRPVSASEYSGLWRRFDARWPGRLDPQAKDASRFWYLPGVLSEEAPYEAHPLTGGMLDPDQVLAEPEPARAPPPTPMAPSDATSEKRAIAYIATMPPAISGQGGHNACFNVARVLARGFALPEHRVLEILRSEYNPRCQPVWSERELRHKARQAVNSSRVPLGHLLEDDTRAIPAESWSPSREWTAGEEAANDAHTTRDDDAPPSREPGDDSDEERSPVAAWQRHGVLTMQEILRDVHARCIISKPAPFVSTGVAALDKVIGGYRRRMITVLGASTNWGKSSLGIMALDDGLRCGKRVLLVSAEDDRLIYGKRVLARRSGVSAMLLRDEVFRGEDAARNLSKIALEVNRAEDFPWFFDAIGKPAEYVAAAVEEIATEGDYDLVIVDYLQAFRLKKRTQDRRNDVTEIARLFVDAIKRSGASGLLMSQLKRLEPANREPTKSDLKESGDIENMAEHVLLGWINDRMQPPAESYHNFSEPEIAWDRVVKVDKNKDGPKPPGAIQVPFVELTASFQRNVPWPRQEDLH